jgi:hypothetical protein
MEESLQGFHSQDEQHRRQWVSLTQPRVVSEPLSSCAIKHDGCGARR